MPRSFKTSQIDKLGRKLRLQAIPSFEDLELLQRIKADYEPAIARTQAILRYSLGVQSSSRPKTVKTIIEKLKREKTRLSSMQDIAGVRTLLPRTLAEQDELVERIMAQFPGARIVDRRSRPSHGYRAVHVLAIVDECPVEIQVRTRLQDLWAQIFEKLADAVGREIRYGMQPPFPAPLSGQLDRVLTGLQKLSADIAGVEQLPNSVQAGEELLAAQLPLIEKEMALLLANVERLPP